MSDPGLLLRACPTCGGWQLALADPLPLVQVVEELEALLDDPLHAQWLMCVCAQQEVTP